MGAYPYYYFYETKSAPEFALQLLRKREFESGRYYPVVDFVDFPITESTPSPGPNHESIDEVFEDMNETGTRSILDITKLSEEEGEMCSACNINDDELIEYYGKLRPTKNDIEANLEVFDDLDRGTCRFCKYYDANDDHIGYFFIGFSFD